MNIAQEIKDGRLAIDYTTPHIFIRQDLYKEMLCVDMLQIAMKVRKAKWYEKLLVCLCKIWLFATGVSWENYLSDIKVMHHLKELRRHINSSIGGVSGEQIKDNARLNFTITDENAKPIYAGYQQGDDWRIQTINKQNKRQHDNY